MYNLLGETLINMYFRDAPSTWLFIHLMNVTSRIFIALSFVSKINAYPTRQLRQAALLNPSMLCKISRVCKNRIVTLGPKQYRYSHRQILRSKNKLNKMWCIVT